MRIESYNFSGNNYTLSPKKQYNNSKYSTGVFQKSGLPFISYQDFNISFGERLNRTPEDFYAQKFNLDNMPDTVRKYLFEDFEERHHMPPAQLQREAFEYLKLADTVQDVKDMYPDEPLFAHLKELDDTKPSQGILLLLKWDAQTSQTPIFKDKQNSDLTVYLLKKVYLEGKTQEELNKDFDKDATDEIKYELGVKDKQYFSPSNIYTLGIRYPKLPYYNSFLATRNDKEYIPPVRKTAVVVSDDTREKLSVAMTKWWAGLDEMERAEQIKKMLNGKEMSNSIFAKYQGQIMTIAAAQMGFSEKLSDIFAEKYADENFVIDFPLFSEQQREIMLEFWNKDPEFRTNYSQALQETIAEFENAYYSDDKTQLEVLLNKALDLKAKVLNKAREKQHIKQEMQKLAPAPPETPTPSGNISSEVKQEMPAAPVKKEKTLDLNSTNTVNKLFRNFQMNTMRFYTDTFKLTFMDFLMKKTTIRDRREIVALCLPESQKILGVDDAEFEEIKRNVAERREKLNDLFNRTNILVAKTNDFVVNKLLYELTGNPEVFKFERGDAMDFIKEHKLEQEVLSRSKQMNSEMKKFAVFSSGKELDTFANMNFDTSVILHINQGFRYYPEFSAQLQKAGYMYDLNHQKPENYKAFLKNYGAAIKYYNNSKTSEHAKEVIMEHMIVDYINWISHREQNAMFDYMSGITPNKKNNDLDKNYDIDLSSLYSLRHGFKQYLHKNETKFWVPDVENAFLDFAASRDYANSEGLSAFLTVNIDKYNRPVSRLSAHDRKIAQVIAKTFNQMVHDDFEWGEPYLANANNAAINYTLYTLTHRPEALANNPIEAANFIKINHQERRLSAASDTIAAKYKAYMSELSEDKINEFYKSAFLPVLMDIAENGVEFTNIEKADKFNANLQVVIDAIKSNDKKLNIIRNLYLSNKKAFIMLLDDSSIPDEDKDVLRERLVVDFVQKYKNFEDRLS